MSPWIAAAGAAFWLGVLTSMSPCLLATNVAAISFLARKVERPRYVVASGACYMLGQSVAFVLLAMLIVSSLVSGPMISHWLQKYSYRLLGPVLVLAAIFLLELIELKPRGGRLKRWAQQWAADEGFWVAALLGLAFAMSFCPTTAALFFGSLIPLAVAHQSSVTLPLMYALGVAVPVFFLSVLVAMAAHEVGRYFRRAVQIERWARRATGVIFLAVGAYFTIAHTLDLL